MDSEFILMHFWYNVNLVDQNSSIYQKEDGSLITTTITSDKYIEDEYHIKKHYIGCFKAKFVSSNHSDTVKPFVSWQTF